MGQTPSSPLSPSSPQSPTIKSSDVTFPTFHMPESTIVRALEYVSQKLTVKGIHVHLVVGGDTLPCLLFKSRPTAHTISILRASALSPRSLSILSKAVQKAEKKFNLCPGWVNTDLETDIDRDYIDFVVHRSLLQNQVIFSSEGLTLIAVDLCFALKAKLEAISRYCLNNDIEDAVVILRRLVIAYRGRPLTKGYIGRSYAKMEVSDQTLLRVNAEYEWQFGSRGVAGVNDEYMGWRREGVVDWNIGLEDISKEVFGCEKNLYGYDKPLPEIPYEAYEFAAIFSREDHFS